MLYGPVRAFFFSFFKHLRKIKLSYQIWTSSKSSVVNNWCILKNMQKGDYILNLKKIVGVIFKIFISGLVSSLSCPTSKTWKYYLYAYLVLCIKFSVSIFISFRDKSTEHSSQRRKYAFAHTNFQKLLF